MRLAALEVVAQRRLQALGALGIARFAHGPQGIKGLRAARKLRLDSAGLIGYSLGPRAAVAQW
ncbi:MAG TPA: hypothetical protein VFB29_03120 [Pseudolabrys sp.]|nr:hypothetical protein [Pseudolabrys sp.]